MPNVKINKTKKSFRRGVRPSKSTNLIRKVAKQEIKKYELENVEMKYITVDGGGTVGPIGDPAPELYNLTQIANDTGDNGRIGVDINLKKLYINRHYEKGAGAIVTQGVRMIVFKWMEDVVPTEADIVSAAVPSSINQLVLANFFRERKGLVLIDDIGETFTNSSLAASDREYVVNLNGRCQFNGTGAGSARKGSIWVLFISDWGPRTAASPAYRFGARISYTDQ